MRLSIPSRFCGPPWSANGGYVASKMADHLSGAVRVRLQQAIPMEESLAVHLHDGAVALRHGGELIARAWQTSLDLDVPAAPSFDDALEATSRYVARDEHPFPRCFVCGTEREEG